MAAEKGFTIIELVTVILLIGILSAVVVSRFSNPAPFAVQQSRDDFVAALLYGQQIAMARDSATNPIRVVASANSVSITENGVPILHGAVQYPLAFANGVSLTPLVTLDFDKLGRTSATVFTLSASGSSATVTLDSSGYAN